MTTILTNQYKIIKQLTLDKLSMKSVSLPVLKLIKLHSLYRKIELDLFTTGELNLINANYEKFLI